MRQLIITLALALSTLCAANAQSAEEWLAKLDNSLGERYAMHIAVTVAKEAPITGYFMVEGDAYYISLGIMEVYSDGKLRYEINNERKEVSEDRVDLKSHDLLTNPTRAFSFLDSEFKMAMRSAHDANTKYIDLTPREDIGITTITLALTSCREASKRYEDLL